jgi:hypothetical protein
MLFWVASFSGIARARGDVSTLQLPAPPPWLPSSWLGNVIAALSMRHFGDAFVWFGLLMVATVVVCPAALAFISGGFVQGWSESITIPRRKAQALQRAPQRASRWVALFRKDVWTLLRTPQLWFSHITSLGFVGYLLVGHKVQTPALPLTIQLAMVQMGFVAVLAGLNPGMTALSLEHGSIWILRAMPFSAIDILKDKFAFAWAQTAFIVSLGAAGLGYGYALGLPGTLALVVFALLMSLCSTSYGLAFDTQFPSFHWENPNSINRGVRMIMPFLAGVATLLLCAGVLGATRVLLHGQRAVEVGIAVCAVIALWSASGAVRVSYRNINSLEV